MKRIISITIALCLVFCSVLPVYAEAWTSQQASSVTQAVTGILTSIVNNGIGFTEWATLLGNGNAPAYYHSFQDLYNRIDWALSWIVPTDLHTSSDPTIMDTLVVLTTYAMDHLPAISSIAGYVSSWMSSNNGYLSNLVLSLSHQYIYSQSDLILRAHSQLGDASDPNYLDGLYYIKLPGSNGTITTTPILWGNGTPLGNVALLVKSLIDNNAQIYSYRWNADLKHYNDNLTTWDSQGSTLTQVAFTPESAIQGLYRYLAFTQRDVA